MKRFLLIALVALLMPVAGVSCAAKKKAKTQEYSNSGVPTRVQKEERDECLIEAQNEPKDEIRAYGSGISTTRDFARHKATMFAKGELVSRLSTTVLNVMKGYRNDLGLGEKSINEDDVKQDIGLMSEREVENCRIICSDVYRLSDGKYECVVCVSIPASKAEAISGAAAMNEDERTQVEFHEEQFRKSYREELEEFRRLSREGK